ncbi:hypothetical protein [Cohnella soli]|uniref:DUF4838 domain-containing protein n=1 Tax=Cohnella soli TaxID=425005 RepID=A0ABW0HSB6_9BACL
MATLRFVHPLIIVSSRHPEYCLFTETFAPYLELWGMAYDIHDCATEGIPANLSQWPLVVLSHPGCLEGSSGMAEAVCQAVGSGTGLVTFGEAISPWASRRSELRASGLISVRNADHPIAKLHQSGERRLFFNLSKAVSPLLAVEGENVAALGQEPLLSLNPSEDAISGKVVVWTTLAWARQDVLGPLYGMDDLLWRSLVWTARKPFVLRCLPPFVTMRVDDVSGFGKRLGGESGLYWMRDCVELGWKPFSGLFLDDLTPEIVEELRPILAAGQATACPHAFSYWDFIYFLHKPRKPELGYWSEAAVCEPLPDEAVAENARKVEAWYEANPGLPMSKVFVPHYYELSAGFLPYLRKWGFRYVLSMNPPDRPYGGTMTYGAPFHTKRLPFATNTPVYYADWYPSGESGDESRFFASVTEIRDDQGYEWAPNENVDDTINHGVNQLSRALDSLVLAQLFTHESGYIQYISPERWRAIMDGVTAYVRERGAIPVTLDDAMAYLVDLKLSRWTGGVLESDGRLTLRFDGVSEGATKVAVFADDALDPVWKTVMPFVGVVEQTV